MKNFNLLNNEKIELNKIKIKDIFKNIKSKYILKKIFDNLSKKKSLYIIKYNQNIQNKINIILMILKNILKYIRQLK